jgi:hypothetical protein
MGVDTYTETWRRIRLRFYIAGGVSWLEAIVFFLIVWRRPPLRVLLILAGVYASVTALLLIWCWWFGCPRCGHNFSFSRKRLSLSNCVNCYLRLGTGASNSG